MIETFLDYWKHAEICLIPLRILVKDVREMMNWPAVYWRKNLVSIRRIISVRSMWHAWKESFVFDENSLHSIELNHPLIYHLRAFDSVESRRDKSNRCLWEFWWCNDRVHDDETLKKDNQSHKVIVNICSTKWDSMESMNRDWPNNANIEQIDHSTDWKRNSPCR